MLSNKIFWMSISMLAILSTSCRKELDGVDRRASDQTQFTLRATVAPMGAGTRALWEYSDNYTPGGKLGFIWEDADESLAVYQAPEGSSLNLDKYVGSLVRPDDGSDLLVAMNDGSASWGESDGLVALFPFAGEGVSVDMDRVDFQFPHKYTQVTSTTDHLRSYMHLYGIIDRNAVDADRDLVLKHVPAVLRFILKNNTEYAQKVSRIVLKGGVNTVASLVFGSTSEGDLMLDQYEVSGSEPEELSISLCGSVASTDPYLLDAGETVALYALCAPTVTADTEYTLEIILKNGAGEDVVETVGVLSGADIADKQFKSGYYYTIQTPLRTGLDNNVILSADPLTVQAGTPVRFTVSNVFNPISLYTGDAGHDYYMSDRYLTSQRPDSESSYFVCDLNETAVGAGQVKDGLLDFGTITSGVGTINPSKMNQSYSATDSWGAGEVIAEIVEDPAIGKNVLKVKSSYQKRWENAYHLTIGKSVPDNKKLVIRWRFSTDKVYSVANDAPSDQVTDANKARLCMEIRLGAIGGGASEIEYLTEGGSKYFETPSLTYIETTWDLSSLITLWETKKAKTMDELSFVNLHIMADGGAFYFGDLFIESISLGDVVYIPYDTGHELTIDGGEAAFEYTYTQPGIYKVVASGVDTIDDQTNLTITVVGE